MLSDKDKRAHYDQFGHAGWTPTTALAGAASLETLETLTWATCSAPSSAASAEGASGPPLAGAMAPQKGESLRASLTITFEEAAFGCEKEINLNRTEECDACHGSGCESGTTAEICPDCRGTGTVRIQRGAGGFASPVRRPAPSAGGPARSSTAPARPAGERAA